MAWLERNGWTIFTGLMVAIVLFGLGDLQQGGTTFVSGEAVLFNRLTGTTWDELRGADPVRPISSTTRSGSVASSW